MARDKVAKQNNVPAAKEEDNADIDLPPSRSLQLHHLMNGQCHSKKVDDAVDYRVR